MGLVRTVDEIARIEHTLQNQRYVNAEMLFVEFLTRPETVRHVLPPGLEPVEEPRVVAQVGRWQSNCVGDFDGGALYVDARHGDIRGSYVLAMYMTTEPAIILGREIFGEPKKQCRVGFHRGQDFVSGWIERNGVRLIEVEGTLERDLGAGRLDGHDFNIKAWPSCTGQGLEDDALLTLTENELELFVRREGSGSVRLNGTVHDPLDEIEVVEVVGATYCEGTIECRTRLLARIPAADYLPYAYGRMDDWSALDTSQGMRVNA